MNKNKYLSFFLHGLICAGLLMVVIYFGQIYGFAVTVISVFKPIILGSVIAFIINILLKKIEKIYAPKSKKPMVIKSRRPVCILISFILIIAVIAAVLLCVIPAVAKTFVILENNIQNVVKWVQEWAEANEDKIPIVADAIQNINIDWSSLIEKVRDFLLSGVGTVIGSTISFVSGTFGMVVDVLMSIIFSLYVLASKEKIKSIIIRLSKKRIPKLYDKLRNFYRLADEKFEAFIVGQCTEAVILGALCGIGMAILRIPYAAVTGILVGFTALIPIVGAYIGAIAGGLLILTVSPVKALIFIIFLVILQQIEGNVIYPKVVGKSIGLPGIWVFVAVIVGGGIAGIPGMLVGVPLFATIYVMLRRYAGPEITPVENTDSPVSENKAAEDKTKENDDSERS